MMAAGHMTIRPATASDHEDIWRIFHAVVAQGDAYVFDPQTTRDDALAYWFRADHHVYVAEENGVILGSYIFRANQPGLGSHVANASYMTSPHARGKGVGKLMGEHSLKEAKRMGFRAMQFNIVVATNDVAVRLWLRLGFRIVGTLPAAFKHARLSYVDAHVMFRELDDIS
jgi:L-amino acid N-acyltransferase YncA